MPKDRLVHSIRDPSDISLLPYIPNRRLLVRSSVKEVGDHWLPGENYVPCSKFKRLLHDNCLPIKKPQVCTTKCQLCKNPLKIKIFPSKKVKKKINVEEVWRDQIPPENPKIQQHFENWLYSNTDCEKYSETKNTGFRKPHHYYHHNVIKMEDPEVEMEKFRFCAGCPDPYRGWIRNLKPDHSFEPTLLLQPKIVETRGPMASVHRERSRAKKALKEVLKNILKSNVSI